MNLNHLLARVEGINTLRKALDDVRQELLMTTVHRLAGDNLEQELQKSVNDFIGKQVEVEVDDISRDVSQKLAEVAKEQIIDAINSPEKDAKSYEFRVPR